MQVIYFNRENDLSREAIKEKKKNKIIKKRACIIIALCERVFDKLFEFFK